MTKAEIVERIVQVVDGRTQFKRGSINCPISGWSSSVV